MKKVILGSLLIFVSLIMAYETWAYWEVLTKPAVLILGAAIGACVAAGALVLLWRPPHPATRHVSSLPSPWERKRWR
jgi:hypothetical protein